MSQPRKATVSVKGAAITVLLHREQDYISLTDIARHRNPDHTDDLIRNWLRNRNTIEFLGIWESLNDPGFKPVEFDGFRRQAGLNSFTLTPKQWIKVTGAVGIGREAVEGIAMLDTDTKSRIDTARDTVVGKVPDPKGIRPRTSRGPRPRAPASRTGRTEDSRFQISEGKARRRGRG